MERRRILLAIIPILGCVLTLLIWTDSARRAHNRKMDEFEERRTVAAEKASAEQAAYWKQREREDAEREARIRARIPDVDDKSAYAEAYRLLHPEQNMRENSEIVVRLLRRDRKLTDIPPRELALLYTAHNNLHDDKQFEVADALWEVAPGTYRALRAMTNALHNKYMFNGETRAPIIEFVDREIARGNGGERELLILKATALANSESELSLAERKKLVSETLIEAMRHPRRQAPGSIGEWVMPADEIWFDHTFVKLFDATEREALNVKLRAALQEQDSPAPVIGRTGRASD